MPPIAPVHEAPVHEDASLAMSRRSLLKTGLAGSLLLTGVSLTAGLSGCATTPAGTQPARNQIAGYDYRFLSADDLILLKALVPAVLGPALPQEAAQREQSVLATMQRMDSGIDGFGDGNRQEFRKLFDMLNLGLTRVTLARVWSSWEHASEAETSAFLTRWRNSSFALFNKAYIAITKVTNVAWYGHVDQWHLSGYPGPPRYALDALPQFQTQS